MQSTAYFIGCDKLRQTLFYIWQLRQVATNFVPYMVVATSCDKPYSIYGGCDTPTLEISGQLHIFEKGCDRQVATDYHIRKLRLVPHPVVPDSYY